MVDWQQERRRLYKRARVEGTGLLRFHKPDSNHITEVIAKITDVSPNGLAVELNADAEVQAGVDVIISISIKNKTEILEGRVMQCIPILGGGFRVGISLPSEGGKDLTYLVSDPVFVNRRQRQRRQSQMLEAGNRQFDRRGFWSGLHSKRFYSQHAWELKNNSAYFYMRPVQSATGAHVVVDGREMIMMSSNSYLGLSSHPKIKEAAIKTINKYGSGPSAPGILGGTLDIHKQLEEALARFKNVEAVCLFSSGYVTNVATLMTILCKEDAVFNDERNHASLIDGSRLSGAEFNPYRHSDAKDLSRKLAKSKARHKLVVSDTVFSMDGDVAALPEIFLTCKKNNAALMVDEAHATGVFGKNGRGLLEHYGMEGKADVVMGTMSKSLCAVGGFIGGSWELINILKHSSRGLIFSASLPPVICAVVLTALELIDSEPERRQNLWRNADLLRTGLRNLGFNTGAGNSPIIPVIFETEQETNMMTKGLQEQGIFVTPVIYPAVKKNATRVRMSVMATHTEQDIEKVLHAFKKQKSMIGV